MMTLFALTPPASIACFVLSLEVGVPEQLMSRCSYPAAGVGRWHGGGVLEEGRHKAIGQRDSVTGAVTASSRRSSGSLSMAENQKGL